MGAALAGPQVELGVIPEAAGHEIAREAQVKPLDLGAERAGLASIGAIALSARNLTQAPHSIVGRVSFRKLVPARLQAISDRTAGFTHATMVKYDDPHRAAYR